MYINYNSSEWTYCNFSFMSTNSIVWCFCRNSGTLFQIKNPSAAILFFSLHLCTSLIYRLLSAHTDRTDLITAVLREPHASPVGLKVLCISEAIIKSPNFEPCSSTSPPLNHNYEKSFSLLRCSHSPHSYVIAFLRHLPKQRKPRLVFDLKKRQRLLCSLKLKAGTGTAFCNSAILSLK